MELVNHVSNFLASLSIVMIREVSFVSKMEVLNDLLGFKSVKGCVVKFNIRPALPRNEILPPVVSKVDLIHGLAVFS